MVRLASLSVDESGAGDTEVLAGAAWRPSRLTSTATSGWPGSKIPHNVWWLFEYGPNSPTPEDHT